MIELITLTYSLTQKDYRLSTKELVFAQNANPFRAEMIILGLLCFVQIINLLFPSISRNSNGYQTIWFALLAIWVFILLGKINHVYNRPYLPTKQSNPDWYQPITVTLDDEGFSATSIKGESKAFWPSLRAFKETKNYIFLKFKGVDGSSYTFLPKHSFESADQKQLVLDFLASKMQGRVNDIKHF